MTKFLNISTDTTLGGNSPSDETVSSQKAIKAYVDNHGSWTPPSQTGNAGKFLTTDGTDTSWGSIPSDSSKANTSLDNLTSTGKNIGNWSSNVTNCITDIPQDIKLELNNGTLILKAGSKVYVPNGSGVFNEVIISSDKTYTSGSGWSTLPYFFFYDTNTNELHQKLVERCSSGATAPSGATYMGWYDTTNNVIKYTGNGGSTWTSGLSFPIGIVFNKTGSEFSSIDQVFNGFGYIGSTVFVLPGVKGLIPNGRNDDGTLKNIPFEVNSVITTTFTGSASTTLFIKNNGTVGEGAMTFYDEVKNYTYYMPSSSGPEYCCLFGTCRITNGVVSNFNPKPTFHAVDYNDAVKYTDKETIVGWGMPDYSAGIAKTVGTSYTAEQNGFIKVDIINSSYGSIVIDGVTVVGTLTNNASVCALSFVFQIAKGQVYNASGVFSITFYPAKGG